MPPPLRLIVNVEGVDDSVDARLAWDDPKPENSPSGLTFSTVMPGGFERCAFTLERDSRITYADTIEMLETLTVSGPGGDVAWQGRLEKTPDTGGFQQQEQPEAVGWQAQLEDDAGAREIYVDQELAKWQGATASRKIALLNLNIDEEDATTSNAGTSTLPALATQLTGTWARKRLSEGWYDARGIPLNLVLGTWEVQAKGKIGDDATTDSNWELVLALSDDDVASAFDISPSLLNEGPVGENGTRRATTGTRRWALAQLTYATGPAGNSGVVYPVYWRALAVYGMHGLPIYPMEGKSIPSGLLASDVIAHALSRFAPKLAFTTGPEGSISPSQFVLPQLAFLEPTTAAEIVKQATRYELEDWAVWEGPTFYMNERGARGNAWRTRVGPGQLQQAGPQVARIWNGVVVQYTDVTGLSRTVGPPGSGAEVQSQALEDSDPENPANEAGLKKWAKLQMGTSTAAGAEKVGEVFLRESKTLESSGQATLMGTVEATNGVVYPAWAVRAGDTLEVVDAAISGARRIVHTSYDDPTRSNAVQLDQPPEQMGALLERLSVALVGLGLS